MKKNIFSRFLLIATLPISLLSSCNYLDVMPPEQPTVESTMETRELMFNFLNSCYHAVLNQNHLNYNNFLSSTDEFVNPPLWNGDESAKAAWNQFNGSDVPAMWTHSYGYIGQCHLFLRTVANANPLGIIEGDKEKCINEVNFLKAYYHYRILENFGPCPIMESYPSQDISSDQIPGRRHYDYGVDYICGLLDQCVTNGLPDTREGAEWGRATATAAKALKSRILVTAASDLWNGKFPFPNWKNKELTGDAGYDEKYGLELVSTTYDKSKWDRALEASLDALNHALTKGNRKLWDMNTAVNLYSNMSRFRNGTPTGDLSKIYVPGVTENLKSSDPALVAEAEEFLKRVITLRMLVNSYEEDGNQENIWAYYQGVDSRGRATLRRQALFPTRILYKNNQWQHGYAAWAPTLYAAEHFFAKDGYLPEDSPSFYDKSEYFQRAGMSGTNRGDIIKLHVNREPRFYAWIGYDGDDYAPAMIDGKPLTLAMRSANNATNGLPGQGWSNDYNRDYSSTGYLTKKYCMINQENTVNGSSDQAGNWECYPMPIIRLAELYLNVSECYAQLGDVNNALKYLNPIRERAGIPELTTTMISTSGKDVIEWVRAERFVELWGESIRYNDVRRWMIAPQQLKANAREGLNVRENVPNPSFEEFNKRTILRQAFQWEDRMYMLPIANDEIYSARKLVQAPNY